MNKFNNEFSEHIDKIKQSNQLIIVEGKKDRKALQNFGIKNIIELNKKPLFEIIENISNNNKKCISGAENDSGKNGKREKRA